MHDAVQMRGKFIFTVAKAEIRPVRAGTKQG
jgi:hypothetical protein